MKLFVVALLSLAISTACTPSNASSASGASGERSSCTLFEVLSGKSRIAVVKNTASDIPDLKFDSYLIRNDQRDSNNVLISSIKAEFGEERWGVDVFLPSGERIGQIDFDGSITPSDEDTCQNHALSAKKSDAHTLQIFDGGQVIGTISGLPKTLLSTQ